jgi:hypothetical protein
MAGWIPFRCGSITEAVVMWQKMLNPMAYWGLGLPPNSYFLAIAMSVCMVVAWFVSTDVLPRVEKRVQNSPISPLMLAQILFYSLLIMFDFVFLQAKRQFVYFQF